MFDSRLILVADTDVRLRHFYGDQLSGDDATALTAEFPAQALARAAARRPDAIVLGNLGTPTAAVDFVRSVRASGGLPTEPASNVPILALAKLTDELTVLRLFEAGVDEVTHARSSYPLLRARLRVLLGLAGSRACAQTLRLGTLTVSAATRQAWLRGDLLALPAKEFDLLARLASDPTRVFTRAELLRDVWAYHPSARTRTLDSHAARLRQKLRAHGDHFLVNVWGVGYRLVDALPGQLRPAA